MRLETRYLTGGALILLALVAIGCSGGPKADAPPPTPTPEPADVEETAVDEEQITEPVTETI